MLKTILAIALLLFLLTSFTGLAIIDSSSRTTETLANIWERLRTSWQKHKTHLFWVILAVLWGLFFCTSIRVSPKFAATWFTLIFTLMSAFLWFISTVVSKKVEKVIEDSLRDTDFAPAQIVSNGADFVRTALAQAEWNQRAAAASCSAALCQTILWWLT
jgi:hypothetical protein